MSWLSVVRAPSYSKEFRLLTVIIACSDQPRLAPEEKALSQVFVQTTTRFVQGCRTGTHRPFVCVRCCLSFSVVAVHVDDDPSKGCLTCLTLTLTTKDS